MNPLQLEIRELAAWSFDHEADRGLVSGAHLRQVALEARRSLADRKPYVSESPILAEETRRASALLAARAEWVAASGEFEGLDWELAIVDLSRIIAFQRRVGFESGERIDIGRMATLDDLLDFALPVTRPSSSICISASTDGSRLTIRTRSPNLAPRFSVVSDHGSNHDIDCVRLLALTGSPYMEVASYCDRWFLRDGYHRSFRLLRQGIRYTPAVVVRAKTMTQLGAVTSKFFAQDVLFSERPPMVTDFLEEGLSMRYFRQDRERVFRISIEEQPAPVFSGGREQESL